MIKQIPLMFLITIFLFASCNEKTKKENDPTFKVEKKENTSSEEATNDKAISIEKIAEMANNGTLSKNFSDSEIKKKNRLINEGTDNVSTIVLNKDSANEVLIDFETKDSIKVYRVTVEGRENKFQSEAGVKTGMSIDELNSLNQKSVDFFGFDWDYGGAVQFNDGTLEKKKLFVYLKTDDKYGKEFIGDTPHTPEEAKAANLNLYVNKIVFEPSKSNEL